MLSPKPNFRPHPATATVGMWIFLASLTMLFAATIIGYVIIRARLGASTALGTIRLPVGLWLSTALMLGASISIHQALSAVRLERQQAMRRYLLVTAALALGFVLVQAPSLAILLRQHARLQQQGVHVYGLVFFMILVHALHVVGGIIGLGMVLARALRHGYDHESHHGIKHAAMYWHFLDIVWLIMFAGMLVMG